MCGVQTFLGMVQTKIRLSIPLRRVTAFNILRIIALVTKRSTCPMTQYTPCRIQLQKAENSSKKTFQGHHCSLSRASIEHRGYNIFFWVLWDYWAWAKYLLLWTTGIRPHLDVAIHTTWCAQISPPTISDSHFRRLSEYPVGAFRLELSSTLSLKFFAAYIEQLSCYAIVWCFQPNIRERQILIWVEWD